MKVPTSSYLLCLMVMLTLVGGDEHNHVVSILVNYDTVTGTENFLTPSTQNFVFLSTKTVKRWYYG